MDALPNVVAGSSSWRGLLCHQMGLQEAKIYLGMLQRVLNCSSLPQDACPCPMKWYLKTFKMCQSSSRANLLWLVLGMKLKCCWPSSLSIWWQCCRDGPVRWGRKKGVRLPHPSVFLRAKVHFVWEEFSQPWKIKDLNTKEKATREGLKLWKYMW